MAEGLPADTFSVGNGCIVVEGMGVKFPLMLDAQGQANQWVRHMEEANDLTVTEPSDTGLVEVLKNAVVRGKPLLLENVSAPLDPVLVPLLEKHDPTIALCERMLVGTSTQKLHPDFRLYMTTYQANPELSVEHVDGVGRELQHCIRRSQLFRTVLHVSDPTTHRETTCFTRRPRIAKSCSSWRIKSCTCFQRAGQSA